jgi:N4-gp56 family major capsid protein
MALGTQPPSYKSGGHYYNNGTDATSGANNLTFYYDRAGIKAATEENLYSQLANSRTMVKGQGREYRVSMWLHILDDRNTTNQGIDSDGTVSDGKVIHIVDGWIAFEDTDADGDPSTVPAEVTAYAADLQDYYDIREQYGFPARTVTIRSVAAAENNGNLYAGSRDIGDVSAKMPVLAEGEGRVNRVGVSKITFSSNLVRYGNFIEYTDEVELFSEDSVQIHYREELGYAAGQIYDDLCQMDLLNGAGVTLYAGAATSLDTMVAGDIVSYDDIRMAAKTLTKNLAKKHTSIVTGSVKVGTTPINAAYFAYIGVDTRYVLEGIKNGTSDAWVPAYKYASAGSLAKNEVGAIHESRFIENTRALYYGAGINGNTNAVDVHPILYVAKDSFSTISLQGKGKISFKSKAPGQISEIDPFGTKGLFSYNFFYGSIVTRPENVLKIMTALE